MILYVNRIFVYEQGKVPQMFGLDVEDALEGLDTYYNFKNVFVRARYSADADYGSVYSQTPETGITQRSTQTMRLFIYDIAEANYSSDFHLPWAVVSAAKDGKKHMLTVAIETTYDQQEAMLAIYDERTAYEDIREMNIVSTEFKVYMPEMDDVGTSVLHFYLDGEEITSQEVRLERIPVITEERA